MLVRDDTVRVVSNEARNLVTRLATAPPRLVPHHQSPPPGAGIMVVSPSNGLSFFSAVPLCVYSLSLIW